MSKIKTTEQILAERQSTHGEYTDHARCTQRIMDALMAEKNWDILSDAQKESLHMFAHKMGRIMVGNPDVNDHWDDIAGYATLVSKRIPGPAAALGVVMMVGGGVNHPTMNTPRGFDPNLDTLEVTRP